MKLGSKRLALVVGIVTCFSALLWAQSRPASAPLPTTRLGPDEYGLQDYTVTTIGAGSFTPESDSTSIPSYATDSNFSRYLLTSSTNEHFYATVTIPAGAVIDFIGLEGACSTPGIVSASLWFVDRHGNVSGIGGIPCTMHSMDSDYNASAIGYQLIRNVHNMLILDININETGSEFGEFSWVEIWWKRTVSPAPPSPTFTDVPTTDPGFQYIEALAASGITAGCGGGNYCPDATLTRRQMAVFLAKALGLHWPY